MSLLVVGSFAYDTVETPKKKVERVLGGSAVFFASAGSLFTKVNAVGVVGEDYDFSQLDFLKKRGVDLDGVKQTAGKTFSWGGIYGDDPNDRTTIFTNLGVFANFKPVIPEKYKRSDFAFLANIDPELQLEVLSQIIRPKLVALDTMNFWIEGKLNALLNVLKKIDVIFINDSEIKLLTGTEDIFKAANKIFDMGPGFVMLKKGEHGAILLSKDNKFFASIYPVAEVVDPTGAGDTFAGGFMGYIGMKNKTDWATLKRAVIYGTAAASFAVEDFSIDRLRHITRKDVEKRVEAIKKMTSF
jgi:sugar/nucleoside kinase (ribokinase family)